ncbi:unnamed protein product [Linum trigynum]|uniref:Pentatricopeptide repeat-containing protein n=1 Tax=Linum trigynum TaxID=586398 RepID=A0AAV2D476_9ROSI
MAIPSVSLHPPSDLLLLQLCNNIHEVRQLHAKFLVSGLINHHPVVPRRLIQAYVATSHVEPAISIFETSIHSPDAFLYNTIIRGLINDSSPDRAILFYKKLLLEGTVIPDNFTHTFVLKACSHLQEDEAVSVGRQVHCWVIKAGGELGSYVHSSLTHLYATLGFMDEAEHVLGESFEENVDAVNAIISGYCRCGRVDEARAKFEGMTDRNVASWSAMITGYTRNEMDLEALSLFQDMSVSDPELIPNESMVVSLLTACGRLGALPQGRWIHKYIERAGMKISTNVSTALIDMYAKCGNIQCSYEIFQHIASRDRDIVLWGTIISGLAKHGQAAKSLELFDEMIGHGIQPNGVIFTAVLSACNHSGLIEKGQECFNQMAKVFRIVPSIEHYGCMVDMLARAGRLAEAEELIASMPEKANSVIWGAFLSSCRMHNDVRRGSWAFQRLMEVEPLSGDRWKLGELMFGNAGRKMEATKIRKLMHETEIETTVGRSFIEVAGVVHEFVAGDIMHNKAEEIYRMCRSIHRTMRKSFMNMTS